MTCCRSLCFTANLAYYVSRVVQVRWPEKRSFSVTTSHNSYPLFLNYPLRNWRRRCAVGRTGVRGSRSCLHNRCRGDIDDVIASFNFQEREVRLSFQTRRPRTPSQLYIKKQGAAMEAVPGRGGVRGRRTCLHNRRRGDIDDVIVSFYFHESPTP